MEKATLSQGESSPNPKDEELQELQELAFELHCKIEALQPYSTSFSGSMGWCVWSTGPKSCTTTEVNLPKALKHPQSKSEPWLL